MPLHLQWPAHCEAPAMSGLLQMNTGPKILNPWRGLGFGVQGLGFRGPEALNPWGQSQRAQNSLIKEYNTLSKSYEDPSYEVGYASFKLPARRYHVDG